MGGPGCPVLAPGFGGGHGRCRAPRVPPPRCRPRIPVPRGRAGGCAFYGSAGLKDPDFLLLLKKKKQKLSRLL